MKQNKSAKKHLEWYKISHAHVQLYHTHCQNDITKCILKCIRRMPTITRIFIMSTLTLKIRSFGYS
jgi:hypothetical protein